jgi:hypothetical protein
VDARTLCLFLEKNYTAKLRTAKLLLFSIFSIFCF